MRKFVLAVVLVLMASGAQGATLNVVGGILHGASGVDVDGSLYDVAFTAEYCASASDYFNGCDTDNPFPDEPTALLASQALLDQVFLDGASGAFDSTPSLIFGCTGFTPSQACIARTPVSIIPAQGYSILRFSAASNGPGGSGTNTAYINQTAASSIVLWSFTHPNAQVPPGVGAIWTATIPEPSTALLLGLGLAGLTTIVTRSIRS